jgi:Flp pilus assembly protein TadD
MPSNGRRINRFARIIERARRIALGFLGIGRRSFFRPALGFAAVLLAAGCVATAGTGPHPAVAQNGAAHAEGNPDEGIFETAAGFYLAARQAERDGDRTLAARYMTEALKRDPDNVNLLRDSFQLTLAEGRIDAAAVLAKRVVAALPDDQLASLLLALEEIKAGQWAAADARLARLSGTGLGLIVGPMARAWALQGEGKTDEALAQIDRLSSVRGFAVLHDFHAALLNDFAGRVAAAEAAYRKAMDSEGSPSFRIAEAFANFFARHGRAKDALALLDRLSAASDRTVRLDEAIRAISSGSVPAPQVRSAADGLAQAMFDIGSALRQETTEQLSLAFIHLSLFLEPDFTIARMTLADMLVGARHGEEAMALYRGVPPSSPLYFSARLRIAEALRDDNKLDAAVKELEQLAAAWPDRPDALATEGDFLRGADRFAEAVTAYDRAIVRIKKIEPRDWSMFYARGVALERSGQWPRAEKDFLEALKLSPDQASVLNYLGYSWVDRGEKLDKAKELIERAVQLRPNDGYIVDSLGWVLFREGDYRRAVAHLERAVELRPDDPVINDHLGDAYWRVGRQNEARFQWRRALTLKPEPDLVNQIGLKLEHGLKVPSAKSGEHDS